MGWGREFWVYIELHKTLIYVGSAVVATRFSLFLQDAKQDP